jgi:hypothetical protein
MKVWENQSPALINEASGILLRNGKKMKCPSHVEKNVIALPNRNKFLDYECDVYHLPYLIKCNCGCEEFEILTNPEPMVMAQCSKCRENITIYNLRHYPAASLVPYAGEKTTYTSPSPYKDTVFNICVVYEYPELEETENFDQNDITWCEIYGFGVKSKKSFRILSDETA